MENDKRGESVMNEYEVLFTWDEEACVWIATSEDVTGLVLEDGSFDALVVRVRQAVPELLTLEGILGNGVFLDYKVMRKERLAVSG